MPTRYKLTKQDLTTYNGFQWQLNEWKETNGIGKLCSEGWLHCYTNPLLAVLLNPVHADIENPKLFECEVEGKCIEDKGRKEGWTRMRLVKEIPLPEISLTQKVAFGILCAREVYKEEKWVNWANNWLSGKDRSKEFADYVDYADYYIAANAAANAANAAANVTNADYANADYYAAAAAANAAAEKEAVCNLIQLANQALKY